MDVPWQEFQPMLNRNPYGSHGESLKRFSAFLAPIVLMLLNAADPLTHHYPDVVQIVVEAGANVFSA